MAPWYSALKLVYSTWCDVLVQVVVRVSDARPSTSDVKLRGEPFLSLIECCLKKFDASVVRYPGYRRTDVDYIWASLTRGSPCSFISQHRGHGTCNCLHSRRNYACVLQRRGQKHRSSNVWGCLGSRHAKLGDGPWYPFNLVRKYFFHVPDEMEVRDNFTLLYANETSTDVRTVDAQAKSSHLCRTFLHKWQNCGCLTSFNMPYSWSYFLLNFCKF